LQNVINFDTNTTVKIMLLKLLFNWRRPVGWNGCEDVLVAVLWTPLASEYPQQLTEPLSGKDESLKDKIMNVKLMGIQYGRIVNFKGH